MTKCFDCRKAIRQEYYVVKDELWDVAPEQRCQLCVGCLENRLGRELVPEDFLRCAANFGYQWGPKSDRLYSRMLGQLEGFDASCHSRRH